MRNILALIATTTVLTLMSTAPIAGLNMIPALYKTPAANGRAMTLYPVAQARF